MKIEEHFRDLAEVAREILGGLGHVCPVGKNHYRCYGLEQKPGFDNKILTRGELFEWLQINLIATYNQNSTLLSCLIDHMIAENDKCKDIAEYAQESPEELIKFLQMVMNKKNFQGECEICKRLR